MSEAKQMADAKVYKDEKDALDDVDSLADTKWSELFHAARTNSTNYSSVEVPVKIEDGELVVGDVVKTRRGEHYHVRNTGWDTVVSIGTKAFMTVDEGASWIQNKLDQKAWGAE